MPLADAHLHLFSHGFAGAGGSSPAGPDELGAYERLRALHHIERALVVGYEAEPRYAGNNAEILELARTRPWMAPLAYLPAAPAPSADRVRELRAAGARGFAVYLPTAADGRAFADWPAEALAALGEERPVISFNATPEGTAAASRAVGALSGCAVVFSHLGLPGRFAGLPARELAYERLAPLLALARHEHVHVKLSGLYAISDPPHDFPHQSARPFVDVVLEALGPHRVLWGSDFSPSLDFVSFAQSADTRLLGGCTPDEVEAVMGANLLRLLSEHGGAS